MIPHLFYYQLVILVLVWLCVMLPHLWPTPSSGLPKRPAGPIKPKRNRSSEPKPFAGLTYRSMFGIRVKTGHSRVRQPEQRAVEAATAPVE